MDDCRAILDHWRDRVQPSRVGSRADAAEGHFVTSELGATVMMQPRRSTERGEFGLSSLVTVISLFAGALGPIATVCWSDADVEAEVDWYVVAVTAPEDWTDEMKKQIVEAVAERVRLEQEKTAARNVRSSRVGIEWDAVRASAPEDWSEQLRSQISSAGYDTHMVASQVRAEYAASVLERTDEEVDWDAVTSISSEAWTDDVRAGILRSVARRARELQQKAAPD